MKGFALTLVLKQRHKRTRNGLLEVPNVKEQRETREYTLIITKHH